MENNIEKVLRENTQDLLEQYLESIKVGCENYLQSLKTKTEWREVDWCKYFGLEPRKANEGTAMEFLTFPKNFYNSKLARKYERIKNDIYKIVRCNEYNKFLERELENGKKHYENSIYKLVDRLNKKGINENFEILEKKLGINFTMTLKSDTGKLVRCWTIVAEGPIQQAHYRFLVK
jgi:hypothetical protein